MKAFFAKAERKVLSRIMKKLTGNSLKDKDMKKIYSFALAAVALLSAASCQKELVDNTIENQGGDFTVTAVASVESKTVLVDGVKTFWTPGDKISVFNAEGKSVAFSTNITANAASAKFTNTATFDAPATLYAAYPDRGGVQALADGIINNFRIAGTQTAVAGSFDPTFGSAVGIEGADGKLEFKSIHALIKFTIGGEKAPSKVTFTNGGARNIAGLFTYNTATGKIGQGDGAKAISLVPAAGQNFEVGKTYYIAVISGGNFANMTLDFDGTVVKTVEGAKYADESNGYLLGKIINLGTVSFPAETEKPVESAINVTRVWGHYGATAAWSNTIISSLDNNDRSLAMDDKFIYIPETNKSANIHKFNIADGSYVGTLPKSADMNLGTHYVSCARTVKNAEGKYILLVCNLSLGEGLRIFAYVNGTDAEPVAITTIANSRRWGDKFTVTGTWESGKMWFRSNDDRGMGAYVPLNGTTSTWNWVEAHAVDNGAAFDAGNISEITFVPGTEGFALLNTNSSAGAHVMKGNAHGAYTEVKTYPALAKTFGYNFFDFAGKKFVAWTSIAKGNDKPRLQIVQSDATTAEKMVETFDNLATRLVFEAPLQSADNFDAAAAGGGNTVCDCCVREINGEVYIAAIGQKAGLSLFKVTAK